MLETGGRHLHRGGAVGRPSIVHLKNAFTHFQKPHEEEVLHCQIFSLLMGNAELLVQLFVDSLLLSLERSLAASEPLLSLQKKKSVL